MRDGLFDGPLMYLIEFFLITVISDIRSTLLLK